MFRNNSQPLNLAKAVYTVALLAVFLLISLATAQADTVKLAWDHSSSSSVTGYRVYYGQTSGSLTTTWPDLSKDVCVGTPATCTYTTPDLPVGTYYFAVRAFDSAGNVSGFSNEVSSTTYTFTTQPSGLTLSYNGVSRVTPFTVRAAVNSSQQISAPGPQQYNSQSYKFSAWSDGNKTADRQITIGNLPQTYNATYVLDTGTTPPPVAKFVPNTTTTGPEPLTVSFTDQSTGNISSVSWTFDGSTVAGTVGGTYVKDFAYGSHTVSLTAIGPGGSNTAPVQTITATAVQPKAIFATPTSGTAPFTTMFTNNSTGTVTDYTWNFGDGSNPLITQTKTNPSYTYASAGTYTVSLTAQGPAGSDTMTQPITVSPASTASGPAAAYNFAEASGNIVVDASGKGNHGTIMNGATRTSGKFDNALTFGGTKYLTIPNSTSLDIRGKGLTLSFFANTTDMGSDQVLIDKPWNSTSYVYPYYQYGVEYMVGSKAFVLFLGDTSGSSRTYSMSAPLGAWTHIAFTYDGANVKGYVNGVLKFSTAATFSIQAMGNPLRIGLDHTGGQPTNGSLDEIRIYNRALSATEIQGNFATSIATDLPPKLLAGSSAGSISNSLAQGLAMAFQTTASVTGYITSIPVYVNASSTSTKLVAGIYKDNGNYSPTLLAKGTLSSPKTVSWNKILLPATAVTAGTKYWIAVLSPTGMLYLPSKADGTVLRQTSRATTLTDLPSTWRTGSSTSGPLSEYGAGY